MKTQLRTACIRVFLLLTLAIAPAFAAGPRYTVTDLGTLDGPSVARAINNAGVVVGTFEDPSIGFEHAFVWRNGVMTRLEDLNADGAAFAMAIGGGGHIAGFASPVPGGGPMHAVRWSNRQIQDLGDGLGNGVDHRGRVVGVDGNGRATLWDQAGTPVNLIPQQTDSQTEARAINARGQVVGGGLRPSANQNGHAFVWHNGIVTDLGVLPSNCGGCENSEARAINTDGQIVGDSLVDNFPGNTHAVMWHNGRITDLGQLPNFTTNQAHGINAAGQVVGVAAPLFGGAADFRAFLWEGGLGMVDLNTLIPATSGWVLTFALGINDRGQIVGVGLHNGESRGFLLTPKFSATINFQPAGTNTPIGYLADTGAAFGNRGNGLRYGWNIDNSAHARERNSPRSPLLRYDTLNHMQKPGGAGRWELAVPNGRYTVHVVAGDPTAIDSIYRINVEGRLLVSGAPTVERRWLEGSATVTVTDGRLTIGNASGSSNNKINYVDIIGR